MIDPHTGIIDGQMHDAIRIGLRRPHVIIGALANGSPGVSSSKIVMTGAVRLLDQVVIVENPNSPWHWAETAAGMTGVTTRPRPDVEDAHFEDVAGLGVSIATGGQEMNADPF